MELGVTSKVTPIDTLLAIDLDSDSMLEHVVVC